MALHNYHEAFGCFPPAYLADERGKPMHSWRVLILPWLEQQAIYDRYRFDEPWDGPNNRKLHDLIISAYTCPSDLRPGHSTAYVAVLGRETAWPGSESITRDAIKDGLDQTIVVVEVSGSSIHWMEPRDLEFDRMNFAINGTNKAAGPSSGHPGVANSLLADGSVRSLPGTTTPETLRALITATGGEAVKED